MKKHLLLCSIAFIILPYTYSQSTNAIYPEPEFSKEVYFLKKDSVNKAIRLEKNSSKMDTKVNMGGFGGAENAYLVEGEKSPVRISGGANLSFIFSTGAPASTSFPQSDSVMKAQGFDPSIISAYGNMNDPSNTITLYKAESAKGNRKIYLMKTGGAFSMGKNKSSDKFTFSLKKIREGYWELVIDKALPKGEYAFAVQGMNMTNMDGSIVIFAFAVD
jgi:hypothetical protein